MASLDRRICNFTSCAEAGKPLEFIDSVVMNRYSRAERHLQPMENGSSITKVLYIPTHQGCILHAAGIVAGVISVKGTFHACRNSLEEGAALPCPQRHGYVAAIACPCSSRPGAE